MLQVFQDFVITRRIIFFPPTYFRILCSVCIFLMTWTCPWPEGRTDSIALEIRTNRSLLHLLLASYFKWSTKTAKMSLGKSCTDCDDCSALWLNQISLMWHICHHITYILKTVNLSLKQSYERDQNLVHD